MDDRPAPEDAGRAFVEAHFPDALAAIVAGSFLRGEATPSSDLDIVVVVDRDEAPFRASYREHGWPIEVFVHTRESLARYLERDTQRYAPSLLTMCQDGIVVRDRDGLATQIKAKAGEQLAAGPEPLTEDALEARRYGLTDILDDFTDCERRDEGLFLATALAEAAASLILLHNRHWIGHSKWVPRALRHFDPALADRMRAALLAYAEHGEKGELVRFAEDALTPVGGRLFEGYYQAGKRSE